MFVPRIVFKFASRERPERFYNAIMNLYETCQDANHYIIFAILDNDDPTLPRYKEIIEKLDLPFLRVNYGLSTSKIDATNRLIPEDIEYDLIINWSDDMKAMVFGFDALIKQYFYSVFPEGDGLLHMSDGDAKSAVPVLYIADKKYFLRDGYIYHPSYISLWADNESMDVAKLRGRYHFVGEIIYHHLNPAYGHLERDAMFDRQQAGHVWVQDELNYHTRKARNFDL